MSQIANLWTTTSLIQDPTHSLEAEPDDEVVLLQEEDVDKPVQLIFGQNREKRDQVQDENFGSENKHLGLAKGTPFN